MGLVEVFLFSGLLFMMGLYGIWANINNLIQCLMCVELILLAASINFVAFSSHHSHVQGQVHALFILVLAACESGVMLSLLVLGYRRFANIDAEKLQALKG